MIKVKQIPEGSFAVTERDGEVDMVVARKVSLVQLERTANGGAVLLMNTQEGPVIISFDADVPISVSIKKMLNPVT